MCGRFALRSPPISVQEHFQLPDAVDLSPRYNIAPSQKIAVVRKLPDEKFRRLDMLRWGLIPHWAKDMKIGYRLINARAETLAEKPSFRIAFRQRRCLVAADGFYEWRHAGKGKEPFFLHLKTDELFGFAGLWESWRGRGGDTVESCTIITTGANELVREIHYRMPVILKPENYAAWLDGPTPPESQLKLLAPYPAEEMEMYRVGSTVNSPKNESQVCIEPV